MDSELFKEFEAVLQNSAELPPLALYIAGSARYKTSLSPKVILKFLQGFYQKIKNGLIPNEMIFKIQACIFDGQIGEAKELLSSLQDQKPQIEPEPIPPQPKYNKAAHLRQLEEEALQLIEIMKKEPVFNQSLKPVQPKLKEQSSLVCNLCNNELRYENCSVMENCAHMFHPNCLFEYISAQIYAQASDIKCPAKNCKAEIHIKDLEASLTPELYKIYQENSLNNLLSSGLVGDIIKCPNQNCTERFALSDDAVVMCPGCRNEICGKCKKLKQACMCLNLHSQHGYVPVATFKRQCPYCETWSDKNGDNNFSKCRNCSNVFCFDCLKIPGVCKCLLPANILH
ncbi:unnamed protein product [Blepharisma stoltei]|uniref:RING-type domain-containing protein n=1 Tax=Blepharisma stoltei TaxID=1481888 RepID=A0AAU9K8X2_9CILI|nr:unnamed protein product [Blepharisma stoltei]